MCVRRHILESTHCADLSGGTFLSQCVMLLTDFPVKAEGTCRPPFEKGHLSIESSPVCHMAVLKAQRIATATRIELPLMLNG